MTADNVVRLLRPAEKDQTAAERVGEELHRIASLSTVAAQGDERADSFAVGARWAVRQISAVLGVPVEHTCPDSQPCPIPGHDRPAEEDFLPPAPCPVRGCGERPDDVAGHLYGAHSVRQLADALAWVWRRLEDELVEGCRLSGEVGDLRRALAEDEAAGSSRPVDGYRSPSLGIPDLERS